MWLCHPDLASRHHRKYFNGRGFADRAIDTAPDACIFTKLCLSRNSVILSTSYSGVFGMNHKGFGKIANAFGNAVPEKTRAGHERIHLDENTLLPTASPAPAMKRPPSPAERASARKAGMASGAKRKAMAGLLMK